jgi:hypothetical protein
MLESALVFLVAFVMLAAVFDLGQLVLFIQYFNERTRAVARYAAVHPYDEANLTTMVTGFMGVKSSMVTVKRYDAGTPADRIEVSIHDYPLQFLSPLMIGGRTPRAFRSVIPVESLGAGE